jgi:hypothetical protein
MTDPICAAIEHHRTALKASEAEPSQALLDAQGDALRDLLATAPTTRAGVFAAFEYFVGLGWDECLAPFAEKLRASKVFEMEAPPPACPVAALLPEARQLIGAMEVFADDVTPADSGERLRQEAVGRLDDDRRAASPGRLATMTSLVTPAGRLDRRAVMIEAHRQFRLMRRYGWSFGRCLSFAWAKAREQRGRLTMSSLEISGLCGKRHDHVLRDADKMLEELGLSTDPKFGASYKDATGRALRLLNHPKRDCLILVSKYSATATLLRQRIASPIL